MRGSSQTTAAEIETFFGIQMIMALIKMSQYAMYCSAEFQCNCIASAMSLKRSELLMRFLHVVDRTRKDNPENQNDQLFKIKPLLELVCQNYLKVKPEEIHSIDEQIIPAKAERSDDVRQYNPKKIHKY